LTPDRIHRNPIGGVSVYRGMIANRPLLWALFLLSTGSGCASRDSGEDRTTGADSTDSAAGVADPDAADETTADGGAAAAVGLPGEYAVEATSFADDPAGCRLGDEPPPWTWELTDPTQPSWALVERVLVDDEVREQSYTCTRDGSTFSCTLETGFDYSTVGQDAAVTLEVHYDGSWDGADTLSSDFWLQFACTGQACDDVAAQWTVSRFPCTNEGSLRGVRR
jgi:hypothetical protein